MFPMTVTINNKAQLEAVIQALGDASDYTKAKAIHDEPDAPEQQGKKQTAAKTVEKPSPQSTASTKVEENNPTASDAPSYDDVSKAIIELAKAGREHALGLLNDYGVKTAKELHPDQYFTVIQSAKMRLSEVNK